MQLVPEHVYTFQHALIHDVAYSSLLQGRLRVLHACIVETLEALAEIRWPGRWTAWPIMLCGARSGTRP